MVEIQLCKDGNEIEKILRILPKISSKSLKNVHISLVYNVQAAHIHHPNLKDYIVLCIFLHTSKNIIFIIYLDYNFFITFAVRRNKNKLENGWFTVFFDDFATWTCFHQEQRRSHKGFARKLSQFGCCQNAKHIKNYEKLRKT